MKGPGRELALRAELAAKCRSCGTCRSVCPIFAEVGLESSAARGKIALIKAVLAGELALTDIFDDRIQLCLNCKSCVAECPNDVRVDDLILSARSGLVEAGRLPFLKRAIFRLLLKRGRLLPPVGRLASFVQRRVLRGLPSGSPLRILLPAVGVDRRRIFPEFAPRSFMATVPETTTASAGGGEDEASTSGPILTDEQKARRRIAREARRVAYFVGCATNLLYPETGRAVVDALSRAGVDVVVPGGQGCCGTPVANAGDFVTAHDMARRNIEAVRNAAVDAVVTACASCGLTLKREYEEILGIERGVGVPVYDFAEFLSYRGWAPRDPGALERVRVTYHDPCHLVRGQGISSEPRDVLRRMPCVEFVEMRDADRCCGSGGTFSLTHYDLSKKIGARKVEAIRDAGVDIVVTECPSCIMHLRDMLAQAGVDIAVASVADIVALGGSPGAGGTS
jgi:glycolate oxidase iron-sulfur subunit